MRVAILNATPCLVPIVGAICSCVSAAFGEAKQIGISGSGLFQGFNYSAARIRIGFQMKPYIDYVIVGAGSAGCLLASRLSEDAACRVVLIEAGGEPDSRLAKVPGAASRMQNTVGTKSSLSR